MPDRSMVAQLYQKLAKTVIAVKERYWPGTQQGDIEDFVQYVMLARMKTYSELAKIPNENNQTTKNHLTSTFPYVFPGKIQVLLKFKGLEYCSKYIKNSDTGSCQIPFFYHVSARRMTAN